MDHQTLIVDYHSRNTVRTAASTDQLALWALVRVPRDRQRSIPLKVLDTEVIIGHFLSPGYQLGA